MGGRDPDEVLLHGGIANAGAVVRVGDEVRRPAGPHVATRQALLGHLRGQGLTCVPEPLGVDGDGRERLGFLAGDVPVPPFPDWACTAQALASTAHLLRRIHDASVGFDRTGATWDAELGAEDGPVICHNDVCPENVVFRRGEAVAIIDWDLASPGTREHDLAHLARMCVPIEPDEDAARTGRAGLDPFVRLRLVADAYGLPRGRAALVGALAEQIDERGAFVRRRVEAGIPAFVELWERLGGQERYDRRWRWFHANEDRFLAAVG